MEISGEVLKIFDEIKVILKKESSGLNLVKKSRYWIYIVTINYLLKPVF